MKKSPVRTSRVLKAVAAASLAVGLIVPTASAAPPSAATAAAPKENMVFTSVSNVLKLRHDTAKNSIGN